MKVPAEMYKNTSKQRHLLLGTETPAQEENVTHINTYAL